MEKKLTSTNFKEFCLDVFFATWSSFFFSTKTEIKIITGLPRSLGVLARCLTDRREQAKGPPCPSFWGVQVSDPKCTTPFWGWICQNVPGAQNQWICCEVSYPYWIHVWYRKLYLLSSLSWESTIHVLPIITSHIWIRSNEGLWRLFRNHSKGNLCFCRENQSWRKCCWWFGGWFLPWK